MSYVTSGPGLVRRPVAALLPVDELDLEPRHGLPHRPRAIVAVLHHGASATTLGEAVNTMRGQFDFKFSTLLCCYFLL